MKASDIGAAIRKRGWLIILVFVVSTLVATIVAYVQTPKYKVQITLAALAPVDPVTGKSDVTIQGGYLFLMPSIATASESLSMAEAVHERLLLQGIDIPPEELLRKASATSPANSASIDITFSDASPTRVAEIANAWGNIMVEKTSDDIETNDPEFKLLLIQGRLAFTNAAVPPQKPNQPKPLLYVGLGAFLGLALGLTLAIVIEYINPYFRNIREVEEDLDLPVLGVIPQIKGPEQTSLISTLPESSMAHEAYAQLRTSLMFSVQESPTRSSAVIPAIPTESVPYVSANLAISMAQGGRRTLLMDCDLKEAALTAIMGQSGKPGLAEALVKGDPIEAKVVDTNVPQLYFLPAGKRTDSSSDLISLPLFDQYLRDLEREYEKVIISTPSLILSVEAVIVGSKADQSLVVVDADKCPRNIALSALESFDLLNARPSGIILHNVKLGRKERAIRARMATSVSGEKEKKVAPEPRVTAKPVKVKEAKDKKRPAAPTRMATAAAKSETRSRIPEPSPVWTPPAARPEEEKPGVVAEERVEAPAAPPEPQRPAAPSPVWTPPAARPEEEKPGVVAEERVEAPAAPPEPQRPAAPSPVWTPPAARPEEERPAAAKVAGATPEETARRRQQPELKVFPTTEGEAYGGITPAYVSTQATEEELGQLKETLADDFRRLGAAGSPIPKEWLRALNAEKPEVKESARIAIRSYYMAFLRRYGIGEERVREITESIMKMMRKEGEFASMNEGEAQQYLQKMLRDAGAKPATSPSARSSTGDTPRAGESSAAKINADERKSGKKGRKFLKQSAKARGRSQKSKNERASREKETPTQPYSRDDIEWD